jgi:flagellar hook-basal body complex protein FliE
MELTAAHAARSYGAARPLTAPDPAGGDPSGSPQAVAGQFADAFMRTLHQADQAAQQTMLGQGDPHALVAALTEAQLAVETTVAVRDRVVEAYLEILRMPV